MRKGFTILEFLIYIAILATAIAGMGLIVSNVFQVGSRTDAVQEISYNGRFVMERMGQLISEASSAEIENGRLNLSFEGTEPSVLFYISEENDRKKLTMEQDDRVFYLTTNRVNVDRLSFEKITENSVRVETTISFHNPQNLPQYEFKSFFITSFALKN